MAERFVASTYAVVLVVEVKNDGVRLIEAWADGFAADTWHTTVADAQATAAHWWGDQIEWQAVPDDVIDPIKYAQKIFGSATV